jgi:hypothetical protein
MTEEVFLKRMKEIKETMKESLVYVEAVAHRDADTLVANALLTHGYKEGIKLYKDLCDNDFWYE